jgi:hypothetical protein
MPSALSKRWTVDQSTSARSANLAADIPNRPRAALICAPEIVDTVVVIPYFMD